MSQSTSAKFRQMNVDIPTPKLAAFRAIQTL
jgi:hypothetical protein